MIALPLLSTPMTKRYRSRDIDPLLETTTIVASTVSLSTSMRG